MPTLVPNLPIVIIHVTIEGKSNSEEIQIKQFKIYL